MKLLPLLERAVRRRLRRSGVASRYVSTPIGRVHLYDAPGIGTGTIVLLHGISATAGPFAPVIARLRRDAARVIAIDLPGHGFSDSPITRLTPELLFETVAGVLATIDEPCVLVGNSLGGALAARYAIARPDRVAALVLLSPGGAASSDEDWQTLRASFDLATRRDALAFIARVQDRPPWIARVIAHELVDRTRRPAVRDLLATTTSDHGVPGTELATLAMPILLWWGESERLLPPAHLAWWRANLPPHAVIEQPTGIGHCPHLDDPTRLAARIAAFTAPGS
jgi:pimeloyl-ACP methyl ester carboxylesterase